MKPVVAAVCFAFFVGLGAAQDRLSQGEAQRFKKVDFVQELPLELEWRRGEKDVDSLLLTVVGRYQAVLPVTRE